MRIAIAFYIILIAGIVFGWVLNIVKILGLNFNEITGEHIIRCFGVFIPPVGGVVGYF